MVEIIQYKGLKKKKKEEVVLVNESDAIVFGGVADGQTDKKFCVKGGRESLQQVFKYFQRYNIRALKQRYIDEIQGELLYAIRNALETLAREANVKIEEFSSTLLSVAIDRYSGDFMILNLGNAMILGIGKDRQVYKLSNPEYGFSKRDTYLNATQCAVSHMRLGFGNISDFPSFVLLTDGAQEVFEKNGLWDELCVFLLEENYEEIKKIMESNRHKDDATMLIVK